MERSILLRLNLFAFSAIVAISIFNPKEKLSSNLNNLSILITHSLIRFILTMRLSERFVKTNRLHLHE